MMNIDDKTRHKIISVIKALLPQTKIYLFGSRARGRYSQWSDVDLALDAGERLDYRDVYEVNDLMKALRTPYKVDVVDLYAVPDPMREEILRDRVTWEA